MKERRNFEISMKTIVIVMKIQLKLHCVVDKKTLVGCTILHTPGDCKCSLNSFEEAREFLKTLEGVQSVSLEPQGGYPEKKNVH